MTKKKTLNQSQSLSKKIKQTKAIKLKDISEEEFLRVLDNIGNRLANKFRFAYHEIEDMKQQAAIFAIEGLENYDNKRPLENFLWTHVRNRLFNYKRNNYQRPDKPCLKCPLFDKNFQNSVSGCSKFRDKNDCEPYKAWSNRNESKKNIMQPSFIEDESQLVKPSGLNNFIENKEIIQFLDNNIESDYRESYLKLKHGVKLPKQQLLKLQNHIKELMIKNNIQNPYEEKNEE
jgi:hypothetical protein